MNKKQRPKIEAQKREMTGKKVKRLRQMGIIPASVNGKDFKSITIQMDAKEANLMFEEHGESGLIDLQIEKETFPVLFKNPQFHPVTGEMIHVDLYKVNLKEKTTVEVPIEIVGESASAKMGNVLINVIDSVEVEALPTDLPENFVVDISKLATLEDMITVADLEYDKEIMTIVTDPEQVIVKTEEPKEEEIVMEETLPEVEGEAEKAEEEGGEEAGTGEQSEKKEEEKKEE
jgi:large subunit ribosomal protein L25